MNNKDNIERYESDLNYGLLYDQVEKRKQQGLYNFAVEPKFKTTKQIFTSNIFTYFNILNFILAVFVFAVGSFKNMFFMGVVVCNIAVGILQEIKAKSIIKKLSIISQPTAAVIRNGTKVNIHISELVLDDIVILESGNQIAADAIVKNGYIEVNESLITGESNLILKNPGDELISGSFVVSGSCIARIENVGDKTYASKLLMDVGKYKDTKIKSEIMRYINIIVKVVSILIVPIGFLRFYKEYFLLHGDVQSSVVYTVASTIGMIPEGIVLLTSIALAMGAVRLAKLKALTQDLFSIETLAMVDILCLDKTGTITEGNMGLDEIIMLGNNCKIEDAYLILNNFCKNTEDKNSTIEAVKKYISKLNIQDAAWDVESKVFFSSERKWSGINFKEGKNVVLGAPEILLKAEINKYQPVIDKYILQGKRILVCGFAKFNLLPNILPEIQPLCFIVLSDKIRESAIETLDFFKKQGVQIKIISGDNAAAISRIAKRVNLEGSQMYVDASELKTDEDFENAVKKYNIFGRTKPEQKRKLIKAYKKLGKTVGMVGDGVNDILALKEADCSVAMAEGSDAARQISKFVLLDSNFKSMPDIVNEGRRVVNNIMRAASMFLIKNIYSFALSLILLFFASSYPFQPIQLTLLGVLTIGLPSFFMTIEVNKSPIKKDFLKTVLLNSLPPSIAIIVNILFVNVAAYYLIDFSQVQISTMAVILTGFCNLMALAKLSKPYNLKHLLLIGFFLISFIFSIVFFKDVFLLSEIDLKMSVVVIILGLYDYWQINFLKLKK